MYIARPYDPKLVIKSLLIMIMVIVAMKLTGGTGFAIVLPFVFGTLFTHKPEKLLFWMLLTVCMLAGNRNLMPKNFVFMVLQRGSMVLLGGCMIIRILGSPVSKALKPFLNVLPYLAYMILPSIFGYSPLVSFLKMFLFLSVYISYLGVVNMVSSDPTNHIVGVRSIMLAVACLFIFGSLAIVPFPGISQLFENEYVYGERTTSLFMGMSMHPQSFGPIISSLSVILFADLLFSIKRFDKFYISLLAVCPYLIYLTSSRTGMGAYLLGMMYVMFWFARTHSPIGRKWRSRVTSTMFAIGFLLVAMAFCMPTVRNGIQSYVLKWNKGDSKITAENVISSRQALLNETIHNWQKSPWIGNGFQVAKHMRGRKRETLSSLLTAPMEKGFFVTAILEEGGVFGMPFFIVFFVSIIWVSAKRGAYIASACSFLLMVANMGEFMMFSMSYTGGFLWAMVFAGLALDTQRMKAEFLERQAAFFQVGQR